MKNNIIFILPLLFIILSNTSCYDNEIDSNSNTRNFIVGIGPVWKNYQNGTSDDVIDMIKKINEVGDMLLVQNNWKDSDPLLAGQVPKYFSDVITIWPTIETPPVQYKNVSYGINFFNQSNGIADIAVNAGDPNNWKNDNTSYSKYSNAALSLCKPPYNAKYIALALEVNTYCDIASQEDYIEFIEKVYKPTYDAIKNINTEIKVFVTFQLEQCKGMGSAAIWGFTPYPHWLLLDHYSGKLDIIAFTTYPEFIFDSPDDIPADYYTSIIINLPESLKNKPIAFVEIGWSDKGSNKITQQNQVDFVNKFLQITKPLDIEFVNWVFMNDNSPSPVNPKLKLGLRDYTGNPRPVWDTWKTLKEKAYIKIMPMDSF